MEGGVLPTPHLLKGILSGFDPNGTRHVLRAAFGAGYSPVLQGLRGWVFSQLVSEKLLAQSGTKVIKLGKMKWSGKPEISNTAQSAEITAQQPHFVSTEHPP